MSITNNVVEVGALTADPDFSFTPSGQALCKFGIAVFAGKDKQSNFFDVTTWGELAQNVNETFKKGDRVIVVGRLDYQTWESKDGAKRNKITITGQQVGPDLTYATARISRVEKQTADSGSTPF